MDRTEALARLDESSFAHLATVTPDNEPHLVPVTFALVGADVVTMVDHKPKTTTQLKRLTNVEHSGRAALMVDHYSDDWDRLWWVRVDGAASVHHEDEPWSRAREALVSKYSQYRSRPPVGPAILIEVDRVSSWESTP